MKKKWDLSKIKECVVTTFIFHRVLTTVGVLDPFSLILDFNKVWMNFEVWRLFTCFVFFGPFSMGFAFNLYLLYNYSNAYETSPFSSDGSSRTDGTSADYCYMLLVGASLLLMISYFLPQMILGPALVFTIVYVWSRRHPNQPCAMFGFKFQGQYLPWVYCAFSIIIGKSPTMNLMGIAVGHIYYFTLQIVPVMYGYNLIQTPKFLIDTFNAGQYSYSYSASGNQVRGNQPARGYRNWGTGRALGTQ